MTKKKMRDIIKASLFANLFCSELAKLRGDEENAAYHAAQASEADYIATATGLMTIDECIEQRIRAEKNAKQHVENIEFLNAHPELLKRANA